MWICTLQSLLLHIIKYPEYENKALQTLPNIYFLLFFSDPIQNGKPKKEEKTDEKYFLYQPCQQKGNQNES